MGFNRTFMELKLDIDCNLRLLTVGFNRTFMELKFSLQGIVDYKHRF